MAVSLLSWFSSAIQGIPQVGADFNIYDKHTTPRYAIGTKIQKQDGNEYAYSHFGDVVTPGMICSTDLSESCLVDSDNIVVAPASSVSGTDGAIGKKFVEITLAAVTVDMYAGGYLTITDGTGIGYTYRIRGNTATGNPVAGNIRIELYDKLKVALDATSDIAIQGSLYANLEGATTTDIAASGVACASMAAGEFGWVQTKGVAGILGAGVVAIGSGAILSATAGAVVTAVETDILERVAVCLAAGDNAGLGVYKLTLN